MLEFLFFHLSRAGGNFMQSTHYVLAYYYLTSIDDPLKEVQIHQEFLSKLDAACRIYISEQGINGQMSLSKKDAPIYIDWLKGRPTFEKVEFKLHEYCEHVFPRLTIKYRKQLVAYANPIDIAERAEHISPKKWREMLESDMEKVLIDVRNDYEWQVGHFEGSELPKCDTFREFEGYAQELLNRIDPKETPVMMCCTGGIRCEFYSAVLKKKGFERVYQLDGGIINYGLKEGSKHWLGKLFVFDDRLVVPISNDATSVIGTCLHCGCPCESYYNCANMDCNRLFLCCNDCLGINIGTCDIKCTSTERLRPYQDQHPHKPFRRWYHYPNCRTNKVQKGVSSVLNRLESSQNTNNLKDFQKSSLED